jgi:hypothetical protein
MRPIFGPHTSQVVKFVTDLRQLSAEQIAAVTRAWREGSDTDRAEAWAQLYRAASKQERYSILAAASVARKEAMDVAQVLHRADWAFWAAAWDAAAAIAAEERIGGHYDVLIAPVVAVMPSLAQGRGSVQVPAQRAGRQAEPEGAGQDSEPARRRPVRPDAAPGPAEKGSGER